MFLEMQGHDRIIVTNVATCAFVPATTRRQRGQSYKLCPY
jgi:hypothetical protein